MKPELRHQRKDGPNEFIYKIVFPIRSLFKAGEINEFSHLWAEESQSVSARRLVHVAVLPFREN